MTKKQIRFFIIELLIVILILGNLVICKAQLNPKQPFDLTKLQPFFDEKIIIDQAERADKLVSYLKEEIASPSPPRMGPGGGPIDSGYIQGAIIHALGLVVTPELIKNALDKETDKDIRDKLTVALGLAGDKNTLKSLIEILKGHTEGSVRLYAARALANFSDTESVDALVHALKDDYTRIVIEDTGSGDKYTIYPVREEAVRGLRMLGVKVDKSGNDWIVDSNTLPTP